MNTQRAFVTVLLVLVTESGSAHAANLAEVDRPNVLLVAIDDLNDWVGYLGGHPQATTPHLDRLAERGVAFTNAHCQAPICNPSRVSFMTGLLPTSTGVYYLGTRLSQAPSTRDRPTIPSQFAEHGYRVAAFGKLVHSHDHEHFPEYGGRFGGVGPVPDPSINFGVTHPLWDWGPLDVPDADMPDACVASAAIEWLQKADPETPFLLGVGFYRPHVPMVVPQAWFERFPVGEVVLPEHRADDLADTSAYAKDATWSVVAPRHRWMLENQQWRRAVQAYLASVSFVDEQVGRVLDALETSPHAERTLVILWSDHGFHLGTKQRWGKRSLWEDSTRVPLVVAPPGDPIGARVESAVGLVDVFPTLIDLCGLPPVEGLDGRTLRALIDDPAAESDRFATTSLGPGSHSVRDQHWRLIRWADGSEELYHTRADPREFDNLAGLPEHRAEQERLRALLPTAPAPMVRGSRHADARPGSPAEIPSDRAAREAQAAAADGGLELSGQ